MASNTGPLVFRKYLKKIYDGFGSEDMKKLRFLCRDFIPAQNLEKAKRGLHLFTELEKLMLISKEDVSFLIELLEGICRKDLVNKAKEWPAASKSVSVEPKISKYRLLLLYIALESTTDELDDMRSMVSDLVSSNMDQIKDGFDFLALLLLYIALESTTDELDDMRSMVSDLVSSNMDQIKDGFDFLVLLEKEGIISKTDVHKLHDILSNELVKEKIKEFERTIHGPFNPGASPLLSEHPALRSANFPDTQQTNVNFTGDPMQPFHQMIQPSSTEYHARQSHSYAYHTDPRQSHGSFNPMGGSGAIPSYNIPSHTNQPYRSRSQECTSPPDRGQMTENSLMRGSSTSDPNHQTSPPSNVAMYSRQSYGQGGYPEADACPADTQQTNTNLIPGSGPRPDNPYPPVFQPSSTVRPSSNPNGASAFHSNTQQPLWMREPTGGHQRPSAAIQPQFAAVSSRHPHANSSQAGACSSNTQQYHANYYTHATNAPQPSPAFHRGSPHYQVPPYAANKTNVPQQQDMSGLERNFGSLSVNKEEEEAKQFTRQTQDVQQQGAMLSINQDHNAAELAAVLASIDTFPQEAGCSPAASNAAGDQSVVPSPHMTASAALERLVCFDNPDTDPSYIDVAPWDDSKLPTQDGPSCYKVNVNTTRGLCLVINNMKFRNSRVKLDDRTGSDKDAVKLLRLFRGLRFEVRYQNDRTAKQMYDQLESIRNRDHRKYDSFVCCILTHGKLGKVYGVDGDLIDIKDLTGLFTGQKCPSLVGKPKIFFLQACQGEDKQIGVAALQMDSPTQEAPTLPNDSHFLVAYSTIPGYASFRSPQEGSWFIITLVEKITKFHQTVDMLNLLGMVSEHIGRCCDKDGFKQCTFLQSTLQKVLYL